MRADIGYTILLLGFASYACRAGGFLLMRYVTLSPALSRVLRAIPMALMGALLGPVAFHGGLPEWAGLATAVLLTRCLRNHFVAMALAVAVVAMLRAALG